MITREEEDELKLIFQGMDDNNDGVLSKYEL